MDHPKAGTTGTADPIVKGASGRVLRAQLALLTCLIEGRKVIPPARHDLPLSILRAALEPPALKPVCRGYPRLLALPPPRLVQATGRIGAGLTEFHFPGSFLPRLDELRAPPPRERVHQGARDRQEELPPHAADEEESSDYSPHHPQLCPNDDRYEDPGNHQQQHLAANRSTSCQESRATSKGMRLPGP